jgi:hypothetical protein
LLQQQVRTAYLKCCAQQPSVVYLFRQGFTIVQSGQQPMLFICLQAEPQGPTGMVRLSNAAHAHNCNSRWSLPFAALFAGLDLSVTRQKALLRAAVFGRAFAASVAAPLLRDTAQRLRLLNALREPDVGLPLTMPQLQALSLPVVVNRCDLVEVGEDVAVAEGWGV